MDYDSFSMYMVGGEELVIFNKVFVRITGDIHAGIILSKIAFWTAKNRFGKSKLRILHDGKLWIARSYDDWWEECCVTKRRARRVIEQLVEMGLIETATFAFAGKNKLHVRMLLDVFLPVFERALGSDDAPEEDENGEKPAGKEGDWCRSGHSLVPFRSLAYTERVTESLVSHIYPAYPGTPEGGGASAGGSEKSETHVNSVDTELPSTDALERYLAGETRQVPAVILPAAKGNLAKDTLRILQSEPLADARKNPVLRFRQEFARALDLIPHISSYGRVGKEAQALIHEQGAEEFLRRLHLFLGNPAQAAWGYEWPNFLKAWGMYTGMAVPGTRNRPGASEQVERAMETVKELGDAGFLERRKEYGS